ncbi:MAG: hypothetical protein O3A10_06855 [Chloroflexi bacterium]|nr:hypothetical protein [Chloroflexota bacterium]MDA1147026.1 hypothetical protein [Chloroflexota bacterium]
MKKLDIPIVCNLDAIRSDELPAQPDAWGLLRAACIGTSEDASGVVFRYPARAELLSAAAAWIARERQCCAFFDFALSLDAGAEEFTVRLGGAAGVKEFLLANMVDAPATA